MTIGAEQTQSVAAGYERWAPIYDETPNPLLALEQRALVPRIPNLAGKRALDLGCGTGRWLTILSERSGGQAIGVDISSAMLRFASQKVGTTGHLIQADCACIPLANETIDFAICSFALSHIQDLTTFSGECRRVLRPRASLFVTDLHLAAYLAGWRTGFRDKYGRTEIKTFMRSEREVIRAFCSAGFNCVGSAGFHFDEAEQPIFKSGGKADFFTEACAIEAMILFIFERRSSVPAYRAGTQIQQLSGDQHSWR